MASVLTNPPIETTNKTAAKVLPLKFKVPVGWVAGMFGTFIMFPVDMVKTRVQASQGSLTPLQALKLIRTTEGGIRGFYKGLIPTLICVGPEKTIKLCVNETLREHFDRQGKLDLSHEILAGGTAGSFQAIITVPMELVKIQMMMQATLPVSQRRTVTQVIQDLGWKGLYRGWAPTLMRDIPYSVIFFPGYAHLKKLTRSHDGTNTMTSNFFSGTVAAAFAAGLVTPCDTIKTNIQKQDGWKHGSIRTCYKMLLAEYKGNRLKFFSGAVPRMITIGPLFGLTLFSFEAMKDHLINEGKL